MHAQKPTNTYTHTWLKVTSESLSSLTLLAKFTDNSKAHSRRAVPSGFVSASGVSVKGTHSLYHA